jgi:hypothetical protein
VKHDLLLEALRQAAFMATGRRHDAFGARVPIGPDYWRDDYFHIPRGDWIYFGTGRLPTRTKLFDVRICYDVAPTDPQMREQEGARPRLVVNDRLPGASVGEMRRRARALYDERKANPPDVNEAFKLLRERLEKDGYAAPRSRLRDQVLKEPEFTRLRRRRGRRSV